MNRRDWSDYRRQEEIEKLMDKIEKLMDKIEKLTVKLDHLMSDDWQKPYPKGIYE